MPLWTKACTPEGAKECPALSIAVNLPQLVYLTHPLISEYVHDSATILWGYLRPCRINRNYRGIALDSMTH